MNHFFTFALRSLEKSMWGQESQHQEREILTTFRPDGYKRHLSIAQLAQWVEYHIISNDEGKEPFFSDGSVAFARCTLGNHIRVVINGPIVETVVGNLLFHPDDVESVTRELTLLHFSKGFC
jgi:hypothetical protein